MNISVVTPRFALTGVPLAQIRFARALARRGHKVKLIIGFVDPAYKLPRYVDIEIEVWGLPKVRSMLMPMVRYLQTEKPDVVFSAEDHLNTITLIAAQISRTKARISVSSRVNPFDTYSNKLFTKRWVLKHLTRLMMGRADAMTCVSKDMVDQYKQIFPNPPHVCVYNIVDEPDSRTRMYEAVEHPWFADKSVPVLIAAGRLAPWKGFGNLIEALNLLLHSRRARLLILGDGPQRQELQLLIEARGLRDCVELVGYVENPLKYFSRANVFVLSSLLEGLPNVLVEAMMCGCTPVATDCPTGPREVLQDGKYGYLVPVRDPKAMAAAIEKALDEPIPAALLAEAVTPFEEQQIINEHFRLLGLPH
jgi:glycosyltransferase involved in cell wall biosynthesis